MKPRTVTILLILATCLNISMYFYKCNCREPDQDRYLQVVDVPEIDYDNLWITPIKTQLPEIAKEVNEKNLKIKNMIVSKMTVKIWDQNSSHRLAGALVCENPNRFIMTIRSILGQELNIGHNDTVFWYWSAHDPKPGIYWAKNEDFTRSRLKTPFAPSFFRTTLGLDQLTDENLINVHQANDATCLVYKIKSGTNEDLRKYVMIDDKLKMVVEVFLSNKQGTLIYSKVNSVAKGLPRDISYYWAEEKRGMNLFFNRVVTNRNISASYWNMPDYSPKINMID